MTDCNGNNVKTGDTVVYILGTTTNPRLKTGTITKIYDDQRKCSVDNHPNIYRNRIMLLQPSEDIAIETLRDKCRNTECCQDCSLEDRLKCVGHKPYANKPFDWE